MFLNLILLFLQTADTNFYLFISFILVFLTYYVCDVAKKPVLACGDGKFKAFLETYCPILQERYWPTLWCFGTHGQTAIANMLRGRLPNLPYQRELLRLRDGGIVALDWLENSLPIEGKLSQPIALFLPGLTGHSQVEYVKSFVPIAQKQGCRCVVFNNRGRGGVDIITSRTYSACNTEDLEEVLAHLQSKFRGCPIFGIGISLGGIILGHYLVKSGKNSKVSAALLISVAFDIHAGVTSLSTPGLNMMLNKHLAQSLCESIKPYKHVFKDSSVNLEHVLQSVTVKDFDARFTSKMFGYSSVEEYYTDATLSGKLESIHVPVLCVNAADDMFCPRSAIPCHEASNINNVAIVITSRGGHIGFLEGFLPVAPFFCERLFEQYLKGLMSLSNDEINQLLS